MFISILCMFRAAMCPSLGELIVSIWHLAYVTLYRWPFGMLGWTRPQSHPNLHTKLGLVNLFYTLCLHLHLTSYCSKFSLRLCVSTNIKSICIRNTWSLRAYNCFAVHLGYMFFLLATPPPPPNSQTTQFWIPQQKTCHPIWYTLQMNSCNYWYIYM
jgi:hypothetical protein